MKTKKVKKPVSKKAKAKKPSVIVKAGKSHKKSNKVASSKKKLVSKKVKNVTEAIETAPVETTQVDNQMVNKEVTKLKVWMMEHRINQKDLAKKTSLSTNTINRLVNNGHATKSVVKLVSYELGISVEQMMELLKFSEPVKS